jgi:hypothetical protein
MKPVSKAILGVCLIGAASQSSDAALFYSISGITSPNSVEFFPITQLYQGPGVGFSAAAPHDGIPGQTWVTDAPGGFPSDYLAVRPAPILIIDLGSNQVLTEMSTWGYTTSNSNGARDFSLRFATSAEGPGAFGTSITYNPSFIAEFSDITRDSNVFSQAVTARYVEMTITDNWQNFVAAPGGDRVGLGEVAFEAVPEPSSVLLAGAAGLFLARLRRRSS